MAQESFATLRSASEERFLALEKRMSVMEHDVAAQRAENARLEETMGKMTDEMFRLERNEHAREHNARYVRGLEDRVRSLETRLLELSTEHQSLDTIVAGLPERVTGMENKLMAVDDVINDLTVGVEGRVTTAMEHAERVSALETRWHWIEGEMKDFTEVRPRRRDEAFLY